MPNHGKGGRKPIGEAAKRAQVPVRTTAELKDRLLAAADASGVSLTVEVERRLRSSLTWDTLELGSKSMELFDAMRFELARAEALTKKKWHSDLRTFAMAREAIYGVLARRCPPLDSLTHEDSYAIDTYQHICAIDAQSDHLGFAVAALHWAVPQNKDGKFDITAPRYDVAGSRADLLQREIHPHREAILQLLDSMDRLHEQRGPLAHDYRLHIQEQIEVIDNAALEWRADEEARGIPPINEYRPGGNLQPVIASSVEGGPPRPTGVFMQQPLDPYFERWHREFVSRRSGPKLDDNPA